MTREQGKAPLRAGFFLWWEGEARRVGLRPKAAGRLQQHAALRLHRTGHCSLRLHNHCDTLYVVCVARFWKVRRMVNDVSFEQIRGSLGSLLLLWSAIERAAREEVARAHDGQLPKSAHGIAAVLNAWEAAVVARQDASSLRILLASTLRAQLQDPLDIRNGVCHGLVGLSAAYGNRPATLTWELNDVKRGITWDELQAAFSWLSKVPFAIGIISNSHQEKSGGRMTDNHENREWWRAEYGLDLLEPRRSVSL